MFLREPFIAVQTKNKKTKNETKQNRRVRFTNIVVIKLLIEYLAIRNINIRKCFF